MPKRPTSRCRNLGGPSTRQLALANDKDSPVNLWSNGVHLTESGHTVLLQQTERILAEHRIVEKLLGYPLLERDAALATYGSMFTRYRPVDYGGRPC
ncbi:hypothetical protein [Streptomyces camelliae]|uniref:Uncharacterized protein n=1 Tax=Streptomyces camelliae TaxID=3004093 RepID=A0ABY7NW87_9ACTN|nr:hypothetical protein [Streptomyces sp. HUAS 2-6]WBO61504.1 hypothetical protein O1G22_00735 [Streptomyces sp. HUAS 2-6]